MVKTHHIVYESLSVVINLRKYLLSNIEVSALTLTSIKHNDTCMNTNVIEQLFKPLPIYSKNTFGVVSCTVLGNGKCLWYWPIDACLDSAHDPIIPMVDGQIIEIEFTIEKGKAKSDAKFTAINSVAIGEVDGGYELVVECQRNSINVADEITKFLHTYKL